MYLVFYPVGSSKFEKYSFDNIDTNNADECAIAFKQLYLEFSNDENFHYYNLSTTDRRSAHLNLDDLNNDLNNEELALENCWSIWLNLTEQQVIDAIDEAETEILNRQGDGETEYFIIGFDKLPVKFEGKCEAWFDFDNCRSDFSKDDDICIIAVKSFPLANNGNGNDHISLIFDTDKNEVIADFTHTGASFDYGLNDVCKNLEWYFTKKKNNEA